MKTFQEIIIYHYVGYCNCYFAAITSVLNYHYPCLFSKVSKWIFVWFLQNGPFLPYALFLNHCLFFLTLSDDVLEIMRFPRLRIQKRKSLLGSNFTWNFKLLTRVSWVLINTAQKMKFSIKDFFSKYDQVRSFLRIWSHLLKKSLMEDFSFGAVLAAIQNELH